jgi:hypothetical protein
VTRYSFQQDPGDNRNDWLAVADGKVIGRVWQCRRGGTLNCLGPHGTPCDRWHGHTRTATANGIRLEQAINTMPNRESTARALYAIRTAWSDMYNAVTST